MQWHKLEVCIENYSSIGDSHIYDTCDTNPIGLLIVWVARSQKVSWMNFGI